MMKKHWYDYIPHPVVMLFGMLVAAWLMSYVIPPGTFERVEIDGRMSVVPGSYKAIVANPMSIMDLFMALPLGFKTAVDIIFIVLASGVMFGFMEQSGAIENAVGTLVKKLGLERKYLIVVIMTFIFGSLGVFVGYENNIAMVPIACLLSLAIGGDLMLAAGISVGAITIGFGLSPVNPYTIGTGQKIAQLPLCSGGELRTGLCLTALSILAYFNVRYFTKINHEPERGLAIGIEKHGFELSKPISNYSMTSRDISIFLSFIGGIIVILYGVFVHHWFINQISAIFCMVTLIIGIINGNSGKEFGTIILKSIGEVAPGAFMVGLATSIKVALDMGQISDTISHFMSQSLVELPLALSAVGMAIAQSMMNFVIPSGSGQALATLPVMVPVGEVLGMTRQSTVFAFQIGDGISNLINPSLGGIVAMLSMCRIPFDRWLRFIFPLFLIVLAISLIFVGLSVPLHYGPF
ncbi:MAG: YfcC family protein [Saprospiraceae bacterium]|nr:YfcC family protein [Saprospiraceae bacterium]